MLEPSTFWRHEPSLSHFFVDHRYCTKRHNRNLRRVKNSVRTHISSRWVAVPNHFPHKTFQPRRRAPIRRWLKPLSTPLYHFPHAKYWTRLSHSGRLLAVCISHGTLKSHLALFLRPSLRFLSSLGNCTGTPVGIETPTRTRTRVPMGKGTACAGLSVWVVDLSCGLTGSRDPHEHFSINYISRV